MIRADYRCVACHCDQEHAVPSPSPDIVECEFCGEEAHWMPSPVVGHVKAGEVLRGKSDERQPNMLDTRPLAEGMPRKEWDAMQHKITRDIMWKRGKKVIE